VSAAVETDVPLPARLMRAMELVYAVEGVVGARIWQWPGGVAIGVTIAATFTSADALRRVEAAVAALRLPEEARDFGLLNAA